MRCAVSNISSASTTRAEPVIAAYRSRSIVSIAGAVSVTLRLGEEVFELQLDNPSLQILHIHRSFQQMTDIAQLQLGTRLPRPIELRQDQILAAYDPEREPRVRHLLASLEFDTPVLASLRGIRSIFTTVGK